MQIEVCTLKSLFPNNRADPEVVFLESVGFEFEEHLPPTYPKGYLRIKKSPVLEIDTAEALFELVRKVTGGSDLSVQVELSNIPGKNPRLHLYNRGYRGSHDS